MLSFSRPAAQAIRSAALLLCASVFAHAAVVTVIPTVTSIGGGLFQYAYSISNTGPDDAFLIDISVPQDPAAATNFITPAGFKSAFDSVLGLASFLEDTSSFTALPTSGFSFDSSFAPGASTFTASLFDNDFNIYTQSGPTLAPTEAALAPEPNYLYLLAFMAPVFLILKRRRTGSILNLPETINQLEVTHVSNS